MRQVLSNYRIFKSLNKVHYKAKVFSLTLFTTRKGLANENLTFVCVWGGNCEVRHYIFIITSNN